MKVLAVANQKGGVGKTTTCRSLAFLAAERGLRVLCVDLDPQKNFSKTLLNFRARNAVIGDEASATLASHLFASDEVKVVPLNCGNGTALLAAERGLVDVGELPLDAIKNPRQALAKISADYDLCIIDTAPTLGKPLYAALIAADYVICPCDIDQDATDGLTDLFDDISRVKHMGWNQDLTILGIVATKVNSRRAADMRGLTALRDALGGLIFKSVLYERAATKVAKNAAVWQGTKGDSHLKAGREMKDFCKEVFKKMGI